VCVCVCVRNIFKILGMEGHKRQHNSEVNRQGNIYFCRRVCHKEQAHSVGSPLGFYLDCNAALPLNWAVYVVG
jgi:hypothetical protein